MTCHVLMFLPARKRTGALVAGAIQCALATGCFDLRSVDIRDTSDADSPPKRLLIDDFEDGDRLPSNGNFGYWQCQQIGVNDQWPFLNCSLGPLGCGSSSNHGFVVAFELRDDPDSNHTRAYPSDEVYTNLSVPMNVKKYEQFVFDVKLVPGELPTPPETYVRVHLSCLNMNPSSEINYDYEIGAGVVPTADWQTHVLPIADFVQFDWLRKNTPIDEQACARAIDVVKFELQPNLLDGASTNGTLTIDNVYLQ